ncbi:MAG: hypothetical protein J5685_02575 [Clostridiales bacterium]|nr:hypothetical protein [Clostridiales bacterium]
MKRFICGALAIAMALSIGSCKTDTKITEDNDETYDTEETADTSASAESTGPDEDPPAVETTPAPLPSGNGSPLSNKLEEYDGTWVDDSGFVCRIDAAGETFTDPYGITYKIIAVSDDVLTICEIIDSVYNPGENGLPVHGMLQVSLAFNGDGVLDILDHEAVRLDSPDGAAIADEVTSLLAGNMFTMGTDSESYGFNEDMTVLINPMLEEGEQPIVFDGISIDMGQDLVAYVGMHDDLITLSYQGSVTPLNSENGRLFGRWLYVDSMTGEVTVLDHSENSGDVYTDPLTGETGTVDSGAPVLSCENRYGVIDYNNREFISFLYGPGIYGAFNESFEGDMIEYSDLDLLVSFDSPYAEDILSRYITVNSGSDETYGYVMDFNEGSLTFDLCSDQWPTDIAYVQAITDYNESFGVGFDISLISSYWNVMRYDDTDITLSFDYDGTPGENTSIYYLDIYEYRSEPVAVDTVFEDGTAYCTLGDPGVYFLGDTMYATELTRQNYFDTDPHTTRWGMNEMAGDIPDLVDLDYIRESMEEGVFYVSNPGQLASVTYFVNTYPDLDRAIEGGDMLWGVCVDITDDIDLAGYNWAPIGADRSYFGSQNGYAGTFCGNGHTISNLTIENSNTTNAFFDYCYMCTVVGLNIEDAVISGSGSSILADDISTAEFADCHVTGQLPDSTSSDGDDLFSARISSGGNQFRDCSYSIISSAGSFEGEINEYEDNEDIINLVIATFDPERDGIYDYSTDYFIDGVGSVLMDD